MRVGTMQGFDTRVQLRRSSNIQTRSSSNIRYHKPRTLLPSSRPSLPAKDVHVAKIAKAVGLYYFCNTSTETIPIVLNHNAKYVISVWEMLWMCSGVEYLCAVYPGSLRQVCPISCRHYRQREHCRERKHSRCQYLKIQSETAACKLTWADFGTLDGV